MTMNFITTREILLASTLLFLTILPTSSFLQEFPSTSSQGRQTEDKIGRLGSSPPNCHNRCNRCSPCTAVQVPSLPNPHAGRAGPQAYDQYDNYKPLGWKCRCGDRFYNP